MRGVTHSNTSRIIKKRGGLKVKKRCSTCKKELLLEEFYRDSYSLDGKTYNCKKCLNKRKRELVEEHQKNLRSGKVKVPPKKRCNRCKKTKKIEMFSKDKFKKDGRNGICKECNKQYRLERKQKHEKEKVQVANLENLVGIKVDLCELGDVVTLERFKNWEAAKEYLQNDFVNLFGWIESKYSRNYIKRNIDAIKSNKDALKFKVERRDWTLELNKIEKGDLKH